MISCDGIVEMHFLLEYHQWITDKEVGDMLGEHLVKPAFAQLALVTATRGSVLRVVTTSRAKSSPARAGRAAASAVVRAVQQQARA